MNTIKQNIKKVARPIYHKVVPEKIRTRRAARLNRSLEYETWITMLEANENYDEKFEYNPKISILVPVYNCLLYTSPSPRDGLLSRMPSSA